MNYLNVDIIASSSAGNAVVIDDGVSKLLLDAGVPYSKLRKHVKVSSLDGVFVTHEHLDHCKGVKELHDRGAELYMSQGTAYAVKKRLNMPVLIYWDLRDQEKEELNHWIVVPFLVDHDVDEPMGFLFESKNTGAKVVYIVDSATVDIKFNGITHWIVEANYDEELLEASGREEWLKDRNRNSHMSIDDLKDFLSFNDMSSTQAIYLVHLSDSNSNENDFKDQIRRLTGVPVYV